MCSLPPQREHLRHFAGVPEIMLPMMSTKGIAEPWNQRNAITRTVVMGSMICRSSFGMSNTTRHIFVLRPLRNTHYTIRHLVQWMSCLNTLGSCDDLLPIGIHLRYQAAGALSRSDNGNCRLFSGWSCHGLTFPSFLDATVGSGCSISYQSSSYIRSGLTHHSPSRLRS